jgi:hypothetical protein
MGKKKDERRAAKAAKRKNIETLVAEVEALTGWGACP